MQGWFPGTVDPSNWGRGSSREHIHTWVTLKLLQDQRDAQIHGNLLKFPCIAPETRLSDLNQPFIIFYSLWVLLVGFGVSHTYIVLWRLEGVS